MSPLVLNAATLRRVIAGFHGALSEHREAIDNLNVYPVPDGDTGTNMTLTVRSVTEGLDGVDDRLEPLCRAVAHGALMGARGNSGVILAQILRGFCGVLRDAASAGQEPDAPVVARALTAASEGAYTAVARPVEGTILTVIREASDAARAASEAGGGLVEVLDAARAQGYDALERTPEMLAVLAEAGVVDAGGAGLLLLLDACLAELDGRPMPAPPKVAAGPTPVASASAAHPVEESSIADLRYEVMFLLDAPDPSVDGFKQAWTEVGDSIVVVGGDGIWNCHIHTDDIGAAIEAGIAVGRPHRIQVTDLLDQAAEHSESFSAPAPPAEHSESFSAPAPPAEHSESFSAPAPPAEHSESFSAPAPPAEHSESFSAPAPPAEHSESFSAPAPPAEHSESFSAPAPPAEHSESFSAPAPPAEHSESFSAPAPPAEHSESFSAPAPPAEHSESFSAPAPPADDGGPAPLAPVAIAEPDRCSVVAVGAGGGVEAVLASMGVSRVVAGGQSMNPSTAELLAAVDSLRTGHVVLLPNNKNIIPVAEQVDGETERTVSVVPTRSVVEGIASLLAFSAASTAVHNAEAMAAAAAAVTAAEVTQAVRDAASSAGPIAAGDWLGIGPAGITAVESEAAAAAAALLSAIIDDDHELLTVLTGADADEAATEAIVGHVSENHPGVEVEVREGGQPLYPYYFGLE